MKEECKFVLIVKLDHTIRFLIKNRSGMVFLNCSGIQRIELKRRLLTGQIIF